MVTKREQKCQEMCNQFGLMAETVKGATLKAGTEKVGMVLGRMEEVELLSRQRQHLLIQVPVT